MPESIHDVTSVKARPERITIHVMTADEQLERCQGPAIPGGSVVAATHPYQLNSLFALDGASPRLYKKTNSPADPLMPTKFPLSTLSLCRRTSC